jgi:hypothetical protein
MNTIISNTAESKKTVVERGAGRLLIGSDNTQASTNEASARKEMAAREIVLFGSKLESGCLS